MKIPLDECVPWTMRRLLINHDCTSVQKRGWGGAKNGDLLQLAEAEFDLFITSDQNLRYQQNLAGHHLAILVLSTNDLCKILAADYMILGAIATMQAAEYRHLEVP